MGLFKNGLIGKVIDEFKGDDNKNQKGTPDPNQGSTTTPPADDTGWDSTTLPYKLPKQDDPGNYDPKTGEKIIDDRDKNFIPDDGIVEETGGVPDYSDEADEISGGMDMDYEVPGVDTESAAPVLDSGTADPTMTPWDVTEEQTVAGQLDKLYDRDSPFFENARQKAIRSHLAGGGQNSAMAAGFGELAAMDTAFKVAFEDARTYARSAEFNAAMANQYSLAEQRFIHNAMLSDQAFKQAAALQTQRVDAQLQSIVMDYKGRGMLMDKEMDQYFLKAKQDYAYQLGVIGAQTDATVRVNAMQAMTNFYINGFASVMDAANNPNLTPEQSAAAMQEGMAWFRQQWDYFSQFQLGLANATSSDQQDFLSYNWMQPNANNQSIPTDSNGYPDWASFPYNPITGEPNQQGG